MGPRDSAPDYTSQEGALELQARIEAYWRARGHDVHIVLAPARFTPQVRAARYDIRSNLVNGQPKDLARSA